MYVDVYIYMVVSLSLCVTVILMCKTHRTNEKQQRVAVSGLPLHWKKKGFWHFSSEGRKDGRKDMIDCGQRGSDEQHNRC